MFILFPHLIMIPFLLFFSLSKHILSFTFTSHNLPPQIGQCTFLTLSRKDLDNVTIYFLLLSSLVANTSVKKYIPTGIYFFYRFSKQPFALPLGVFLLFLEHFHLYMYSHQPANVYYSYHIYL